MLSNPLVAESGDTVAMDLEMVVTVVSIAAGFLDKILDQDGLDAGGLLVALGWWKLHLEMQR